jgi:hypothetical protein
MVVSQQRLESRKRHLDASLVPFENALLERAQHLESIVAIEEGHLGHQNLREIYSRLAQEFVLLAEELHYW